VLAKTDPSDGDNFTERWASWLLWILSAFVPGCNVAELWTRLVIRGGRRQPSLSQAESKASKGRNLRLAALMIAWPMPSGQVLRRVGTKKNQSAFHLTGFYEDCRESRHPDRAGGLTVVIVALGFLVLVALAADEVDDQLWQGDQRKDESN